MPKSQRRGACCEKASWSKHRRVLTPQTSVGPVSHKFGACALGLRSSELWLKTSELPFDKALDSKPYTFLRISEDFFPLRGSKNTVEQGTM